MAKESKDAIRRRTSFAVPATPKDPFLIRDSVPYEDSETKESPPQDGHFQHRKSVLGLRDAVKDLKLPKDHSLHLPRHTPDAHPEVRPMLADQLPAGHRDSHTTVMSRQPPMTPRPTLGTLDAAPVTSKKSPRVLRDQAMCGQKLVRSTRLFNAARKELLSEVPAFHFPIEKVCSIGRKKLTIDRVLKIKNGSRI